MRNVARLLIPVLGLSLLLPLANLRASEPAKATGTISGKVVHEDGSAAGGLEVRVMVAPPKKDKAPKIALKEPGEEKPKGDGKGKKGERPEAVAKGTTSADGSFSLAVPAGDYVVMSGKRGEGMGRERVTVADGQTVTVNITLKKLEPGAGGGKKGDK